ncbi:MAG: lipid A deacylase LpxR family protein [Bacteroidetes bacterium]|nr:lipid A deacylase LpxR family protein [Bacteroidota bacterium]
MINSAFDKILIIIFLLLSIFCYCQEKSDLVNSTIFFVNQFVVYHDNDFFSSTDRYYTTGNFIGYRHNLSKGIEDGTRQQLSYFIEHQIYTPTNKISSNFKDFDRPYAGFLGFSTRWSIASKDQLFKVKFLFGFTGPVSGGSGFQKFFHGTGGIGTIPKWVDQIENSMHLNLYLNYFKEWTLPITPLDVHLALGTNFAFGSKDMFSDLQLATHIGKKNPLLSSMAYDQFGVIKTEYFLTLMVSYRYIFHDATFQGNRFGDSSPFTIKPTNKVTDLTIGFNYRFGRNDIKIFTIYTSSKAISNEPHVFNRLYYARSF